MWLHQHFTISKLIQTQNASGTLTQNVKTESGEKLRDITIESSLFNH